MRRPRSRGQALTEVAIAAPLLVLLLVGGVQIGFLVYAQVTVDTAAREGARVGAEQPNGSQAYSSGVAGSSVVCTPPTSNPVCNAVWNASGLINGQSSFRVTISPQALSSSYTAPASCSSSGSVADGYVSVHVEYDAPIFVPLIDRLLTTAAGVHTVWTTVRDRVDPCTVTNGQ